MTPLERVRPRDRDAVLQSLKAGVVPRRGQHLIQVGRAAEVAALMEDLDRVVDGGASMRFVIGPYGSGKTFFLHLIRSIALEKGLLTMHADLNPDRRLHATGGQARNLYSELTRNLATRTKPEGEGLSSVVERFVGSARQEADRTASDVEDVIRQRTSSLEEMVGGYDFATVVVRYWEGYRDSQNDKMANAIRWLRGEYSTKTDARRDLGVRSFIDDTNVYDQLKLFAKFARMAGYAGVLVALDELVNLYKLAHSQARRSNYEQILRILNDCLQGSVEHLGFVLGGTPEFLMDTRRGLYSYEALQSRLAENAFAATGFRDLSGPVVRLANLTPEELYVLLQKLRHVQAAGDPEKYLVPDEALESFMAYCADRIGAQYFQTPRNTVKAFVQLLAILDQNPDAEWRELLGEVDVTEDTDPDLLEPSVDTAATDDDLTTFRL